MKHWLLSVSLICFGSTAMAQTPDIPAAPPSVLTLPVAAPATPSAPELPPSLQPASELTVSGVPDLIAQKIKEAKAAYIGDLHGNSGAGAYVPIWVFHDNPRQNDYLELPDIGWRTLQGHRPSLVLSGAVNVVAVSGWLWRSTWAQNHVARSPFPPVFLGVGPNLPADYPQLKTLKLNDPKGWLVVTISVRFKSLAAAVP